MKQHKRVRTKAALTGILLAGILMAGGCSKETALEESTAAVQTIEESTVEESSTSADAESTKSEEETVKETEELETTAWNDGNGTHIMIGTDNHYLSQSLTDYGMAFNYMVENGDGKVVNYIDQITDAFIEDVIRQNPDILILSGDLTLNGEKQSHTDFAQKLSLIEDKGIPVAVIPGNHDINCPGAASFSQGSMLPAEQTTPEQFKDIYKEYGYSEAMDKDPYSLSYVYKVNDSLWLLMLDSCQYDPSALVGGMIKDETYQWIRTWLDRALEEGVEILPVTHHNLLDESRVYIDDCTIEHSEQMVQLWAENGIFLHLSGHMHVQHFREDEDSSVCEIVTSSLATPPCQYGLLTLKKDYGYEYHTQILDIESWAERHQITDENLLNFDEYKGPFLKRVFYNQASYELRKLEIPEEEIANMSELYAYLNCASYEGKAYEIRDEVLADPVYKLWEQYGRDTILYEYMKEIIQDAVVDYNHLEK